MATILDILPVKAKDWNKTKIISLLPALLNEACEAWNISRPRLSIRPLKGNGTCFNGHIIVSSKCKCPVQTPGFSWRFPGYKVDTTFIGVLYHELGHHLHFTKRHLWQEWPTQIDAITTYAGKRKSEQIAEAMKLFATNPDFLKQAFGSQYRYITERVGLQPLHNLSLEEVLKFAHPNFLNAAKRFIRKYTND